MTWLVQKKYTGLKKDFKNSDGIKVPFSHSNDCKNISHPFEYEVVLICWFYGNGIEILKPKLPSYAFLRQRYTKFSNFKEFCKNRLFFPMCRKFKQKLLLSYSILRNLFFPKVFKFSYWSWCGTVVIDKRAFLWKKILKPVVIIYI